MTVIDYNLRYSHLWLERACEREEKVFCLLTIKAGAQVQMYTTDEVKKEDLIKQFRYIADELEKQAGKIIQL